MLTPAPEGFVQSFRAMASPCEVRIDSHDRALAVRLGGAAMAEAARIEAKFSRYRTDNLIAQINAADGAAVELDDETAALIDYAAHCHALSEGRFDITSGVLRRIWRFDGSDRVPSKRQVSAIMPLVGWDKVTWRRPWLTLPTGMEIDLGGLGKEYAVDSTLLKLMELTQAPCWSISVATCGFRVRAPMANAGAWPLNSLSILVCPRPCSRSRRAP